MKNNARSHSWVITFLRQHYPYLCNCLLKSLIYFELTVNFDLVYFISNYCKKNVSLPFRNSTHLFWDMTNTASLWQLHAQRCSWNPSVPLQTLSQFSSNINLSRSSSCVFRVTLFNLCDIDCCVKTNKIKQILIKLCSIFL